MGGEVRSWCLRLVGAPRTKSPELDLRADLLATLEVVLLALVSVLGMGVLPCWQKPEAPLETTTFHAAAFLTAAVFVCIAMNRRGHTEASARLFMLTTLAAAIWVGVGLPILLLTTTIVVLLAIALFPLNVAATIGLLALLLEPLALFGGAAPADLVVPLCINGSVLALGLVLQMYRSRLERHRANEAHVLQTQLWHSQRLDALGQLAGGIAHDFNNLLTAIVGSADLAAEGLDRRHPVQEDLRAVLDATERAVRVTGKLLAFSRRQVMQSEAVDLHAKVIEAAGLLRRLLRDDILVTSSKDNDPGWVLVDPVQLEQVIVNLALNAGDAMPSGGSLMLTTSSVVVSDTATVADLSPGSYGQLRVSDTGAGISPDVLPHIFEPFYTTKDRHRGTGLGLATVYGITQQSGGAVRVESTSGKGAVFDVFFPSVAAPIHSRSSAPISATSSENPQGRSIFVVEDDELVRRLTVRTLSQAGYRVLDFPSGAEALRGLETYEGDVPLLLTDVVMLGMNGVEVAERFAERHPTTRVLLMSGYADDLLARTGVHEAGRAFLEKPFTPARLLQALRALVATPEVPRV